jgi:hypothetical protein
MFLRGLIIGMSNYVNVEIVFREFEIREVVLAELELVIEMRNAGWI